MIASESAIPMVWKGKDEFVTAGKQDRLGGNSRFLNRPELAIIGSTSDPILMFLMTSAQGVRVRVDPHRLHGVPGGVD